METHCSMDLMLILSLSTRGKACPYSPIAEREREGLLTAEIHSVFLAGFLASSQHEVMRGDVGRGPFCTCRCCTLECGFNLIGQQVVWVDRVRNICCILCCSSWPWGCSEEQVQLSFSSSSCWSSVRISGTRKHSSKKLTRDWLRCCCVPSLCRKCPSSG